MHQRAVRHAALLFLLLLLAALLSACGSDKIPKLDQNYQRIPPPLLLPEASGTVQEAKEEGGESGVIDMSHLDQGYVMANVVTDVRAKFQVKMGDEVYNYDITNDGCFETYSLSFGSGSYEFVLYIQTEGNNYRQFLAAAAEVELQTEFAPFLVPNQSVYFDQNSSYIALSYDLAQHAQTDLQVVQQVYHWVAQNIDYDTDKAEQLRDTTGYIPDLEELMLTQKGICYDYAALVAAMLRANGIPCKLIKGDVLADEVGYVYHAWNMIWLEGSGWITVKIEVTPGEWERIDLTFAASGGRNIEGFIGDGTNYSPLYAM